MIYKVRKDWKVLVRCKKGESRELIKRCQVGKHLLLIHLLLKESLFLSWRVHFVSSSKIWTCKSMVVRK